MDITIIDAEKADPKMLESVMARALHFERATTCNIYVADRVPLDAPEYSHPGWLEYALNVVFEDGGNLWIGCIQRKPGEPIEFHS